MMVHDEKWFKAMLRMDRRRPLPPKVVETYERLVALMPQVKRTGLERNMLATVLLVCGIKMQIGKNAQGGEILLVDGVDLSISEKEEKPVAEPVKTETHSAGKR